MKILLYDMNNLKIFSIYPIFHLYTSDIVILPDLKNTLTLDDAIFFDYTHDKYQISYLLHYKTNDCIFYSPHNSPIIYKYYPIPENPS